MCAIRRSLLLLAATVVGDAGTTQSRISRLREQIDRCLRQGPWTLVRRISDAIGVGVSRADCKALMALIRETPLMVYALHVLVGFFSFAFAIVGGLAAEDVLVKPYSEISALFSLVALLGLAFLLPALMTARGRRPFWIFGLLFNSPFLLTFFWGGLHGATWSKTDLIPLVGFGVIPTVAGVAGGYWGRRFHRHPEKEITWGRETVTLALVLGCWAVPMFGTLFPLAGLLSSGVALYFVRSGEVPAFERLFVLVGLVASLVGLSLGVVALKLWL